MSSKTWVSSSFDIENDFLQEPEKSSTHRKRKLQQIHKFDGKKLFSKSAIVKNEIQSWVEKYAPISKDTLAVNKKKISQVEAWLKNYLFNLSSKHLSPILLLTGPAGTGKTATVKVLAKEMNLNLMEWSNTAINSSQDLVNFEMQRDQNVLYHESQCTQFTRFVLKTNKYNLFTNYNKNKIILVEEYPNVFLRDSSQFHNVIQKYHRLGKCPIIFIITDNSRGQSLEQLLFPRHIKELLNISGISFNPIAPSLVVKALQRIMEESGINCKSNTEAKHFIEELANSCAGDIRNAINTLQFNYDLKIQNLKNKNKQKSKNIENKVSSSFHGRDASLFLFHSLGKILYCKRDVSKKKDAFPVNSKHLERPPLQENPEDIFEKTTISSSAFCLFLHQNYLDFMEKVETVVDCCTYFSDCDIISSDWTEQSILDKYTATLSSRALMFNLYSEIVPRHKWKPLHKPQWYSSFKTHNEHSTALKYMFKDWRTNTRILKTDILPYSVKIPYFKFSKEERDFVRNAIIFNFQKYGMRHKIDSLTEKDIFEENIEEENSKYTRNQLDDLNNDVEDEIIIEDYDD